MRECSIGPDRVWLNMDDHGRGAQLDEAVGAEGRYQRRQVRLEQPRKRVVGDVAGGDEQ